MTKGICMKTESLYLKCSSVPAVYFPPKVIILFVASQLVAVEMIMSSQTEDYDFRWGDKQQEQMNS